MDQNVLRPSTLTSSFKQQSNLQNFLTGEEFKHYSYQNLKIFELFEQQWYLKTNRSELSKNSFGPLEFLNLLYEQLDIIGRYYTRPIEVMYHLLTLPISPHLRLFLFIRIIEFDYYIVRNYDDPKKDVPIFIQGTPCMKMIRKELLIQLSLLYPSRTPQFTFDFKPTEIRLDYIDNPEDKIFYLLDRIMLCKQQMKYVKLGYYKDNGPEYIQQCEDMIEHIKRLQSERFYKKEALRPNYMYPIGILINVHSAFNNEFWKEMDLNDFCSLFDINNRNHIDFKVKRKTNFYALLWSMHNNFSKEVPHEEFIIPFLKSYNLKYSSFGNIKLNRIDSDKLTAKKIMKRIEQAMK